MTDVPRVPPAECPGCAALRARVEALEARMAAVSEQVGAVDERTFMLTPIGPGAQIDDWLERASREAAELVNSAIESPLPGDLLSTCSDEDLAAVEVPSEMDIRGASGMQRLPPYMRRHPRWP